MKATLIFIEMDLRNSFLANHVTSMFEVSSSDIIFSRKPRTKPKTDYSVLDI